MASLFAFGGSGDVGSIRSIEDLEQFEWGFIVDTTRCIGCGSCVRACKIENNVPDHYFRTWVERYHVPGGDIERPIVDSPNGGYDGFEEKYSPGDGSKNFFVPKLCNQCAHSPCVQVCPIGATFESPDGAYPYEYDYTLWLNLEPVATENHSWSEVKSLFD